MNNTSKIHAFYVLLILGATIVMLVSVEWVAIPDLPGLITFALTVTSLVLAVLAIVYAYVSNASATRTIARLADAASAIGVSAEEVRGATASLRTEVASLPEMIQSVGERVDQASALWKEASSQQLPPPAAETARHDEGAAGRRFVAIASISGTLLLLACKKALEKKKPIDLKALALAASIRSPDYMHGFLVAAAGAGMVTYSGSADAVLVESMPKSIFDDLEGRVLTKIDTVATSPASRTRMISYIAGISTYFDDPPPEAPTAVGESGGGGVGAT